MVPSSFALIIIGFFFTFCEFRCGDQKIGSLTGINLVTGTNLKTLELMKPKNDESTRVPPNVFAIIALSSAVFGLGIYLIRVKGEAIFGTIVGAVGLVCLILVQYVIKSGIDQKGKGIIETNLMIGYWMAMIGFVVATFLCYKRIQYDKNAHAIQPTIPTLEQSSGSDSIQVP